jgi:hypothetical protein
MQMGLEVSFRRNSEGKSNELGVGKKAEEE